MPSASPEAGRPRIVVAPDKFKGCCSAAEAAAAIVAGLRDVWGDGPVYRTIPMADGGDGTVEAFLDGGATAVSATVRGPLGAPVVARYARDGAVAIIEMAAASGLVLAGARRDALRATTFGTGELIAHAIASGARRIVLGIGGSATTDGGAGALAALGVRFLDAAGRELEPVPAGLAALARIDASGLDERLAGIEIDVACDVANPLAGPAGAAFVYGPQKGATPAEAAALDALLERLAALALVATGKDLRAMPGAGAAGGLGWGLATFAGATICRGFTLVAELRGLSDALRGAALCLTAEGSIDAQTLHGKVVDGVATLCAAAGVPAVAFGGAVDAGVEAALWARGAACLPIVPRPLDLATAMREAPALIRAAAARLARLRPRPDAS